LVLCSAAPIPLPTLCPAVLKSTSAISLCGRQREWAATQKLRRGFRMLNSRKGNLPCFQWEVARFQRAHREKMAAVTAQTKNRPTLKQQLRRKDGLRNTD
ncbi:unnamed protein product, partial [Ectocarpus sp. 12 AP-2014]